MSDERLEAIRNAAGYEFNPGTLSLSVGWELLAEVDRLRSEFACVAVAFRLACEELAERRSENMHRTKQPWTADAVAAEFLAEADQA